MIEWNLVGQVGAGLAGVWLLGILLRVRPQRLARSAPTRHERLDDE